MTVFIVPAACFITGLVAGIWLELFYASVAMSHSQERMQRKVRAAQAQAAYYQAMSGSLPGLPGSHVPDDQEAS